MNEEHLEHIDFQMHPNFVCLPITLNAGYQAVNEANKDQNLNSNKAKNNLNCSASGGENLDSSVSTVHTINNTIGTNKNLNFTSFLSSNGGNSDQDKSNTLSSKNNFSVSGNPISKFSPLPKPDFTCLEKKENSLSYMNKGSYKKPKSNVPDSPIKTPHKFASTPGNAYKLGKKNLKKTACRKLNFFVDKEESEELILTNSDFNADNAYGIGSFKNNDSDAKALGGSLNNFINSNYKNEDSNLNNLNNLINNQNSINSNNFSNCNFNFENIEFGCSSSGIRSDNMFKNPFSAFTAESLQSFKNEQELKNHETNKLIKNCKKRVFICEHETSEFQLNDPANDFDIMNNSNKFNSAKKSSNGSKKGNSRTNSINNPINNLTPKKLKMPNLHSNTKKNLLRNKYRKNNQNSDYDDDYETEKCGESDIEISEFDINYDQNENGNGFANRKNSIFLQHTHSKLSLNESRNSTEFHSKQEAFNLKSCENTKKSSDDPWNNANGNFKKNINTQNKTENEAYGNFINNFSVSKFNLEPELEQLDYHSRSDLMPTNYERENPQMNLNLKFNFMEEKKFSFGKQEDEEMTERNYNFYASNPFNYNEIMNELNDFSKRSSDVSKFENDYGMIKTLDSGSFGVVYKCLSNVDGKIYAVKKTKKMVGKGESYIILNLINDLNVMSNFNCLSNFIVKYMESWLEEGLLYIKQEYCQHGDLLDFLQKLEEKNYHFDTEFYWDIYFEMICGLKYFHESGYLHLDIKPQNFLVALDGTVKLGDFNLSRKKENYYADYFEGDSVYLAPEILEVNKFKQLSEKCDIFSLGLSLLEILCKIELPQNGFLWHQIRSAGFKIPSEFLQNSNLKEIPISLINVIEDMIVFDIQNRKDLNYLIDYYPELLFRFERLSRNEYAKSYSNFINNENFISGLDDNHISKRSESYKFSSNK